MTQKLTGIVTGKFLDDQNFLDKGQIGDKRLVQRGKDLYVLLRLNGKIERYHIQYYGEAQVSKNGGEVE